MRSSSSVSIAVSKRLIVPDVDQAPLPLRSHGSSPALLPRMRNDAQCARGIRARARAGCVLNFASRAQSSDHLGDQVISPSDPENNGRLLTEQLRGLGLYAADTLGDGNCLFRALSDQLYGSPSRHALLRARVCDWIEAHGERYAPFVEDERGLEAHLRCMRENGTSSTHSARVVC